MLRTKKKREKQLIDLVCLLADTSVGQHILKNPLIVDNMITKVKRENILRLTLLLILFLG
jgi:hypothetical protein